VRNWIVVKLNSAPKLHHRKVKNVQKQVSKNSAQWYGRQEERQVSASAPLAFWKINQN
jgi:hypothetical protein